MTTSLVQCPFTALGGLQEEDVEEGRNNCDHIIDAQSLGLPRAWKYQASYCAKRVLGSACVAKIASNWEHLSSD